MWITAILWIFLLNQAAGQFDTEFTLQNVWGRLQPDLRSLIQCLSDENYKKIKFSRVMDTGQGVKLPKSSQQFLQAKPVAARILFMPGEDKSARFGVFQCKTTKKNIDTKIVTLKLPPYEFVELDAISPYNVANLGDDLFLEINVTKKLELPLKWRHNGKELPDWTGLAKVHLQDVQVSNAGTYECYYDGRRNEGVHALMRVLVRSCPADLYGPDCDKECPPCYNGGICQDKWGVCVCPAGFAGENCEIACGGNHFGPDCSKFCSPPTNNSNTDELCALHLFCKPDPYGCSCAPGFKGSKCMKHCEPGWYGADCKQPCHCAYGISSCNRITGACDGGCARGWRGNSCQIEDPNSNNSIETTTMVYCSPGSYGPSCERQCHCAGNEHCHIITGHCSSGCEEGWGGPTCGACRSGLFGENCEFTCHCEGGNHNCDKDGFCYSGCEAGWAGFTCQTECTPGRFGSNCASTCHCHQTSTKPCDKVTGECEGDCEAGYMGKDCQTLCRPNMYGVNCLNTCICFNGAQCNRIDGSCACEGRWRGNICNESEPQIIAATDEEVNAGHQVFISCTADAVPEPHMNLTSTEFPGLKVSVRNLEQNQLQAIVKSKPEKSGSFEFLCTARNEHGFDMKKIFLTVIDPPKLKTKPVLTDKSNNSISIQWKEWEYSKDEGGSITDRIEYLVVYKASEAFNWERADGWKMEDYATIGNLIPNTIYSIGVKSRRFGKGGEGDPGPLLQVKTDCGDALPDGIPQEFLPEKITQTSVVLTWRNPSNSFLRCSLASYHITYYPETLELIKSTIDTDDVSTRFTLEDLTPNTNYVVRLHPVTELEKSKYYAELILKTSEIAPGPVSNLECQAVTEKPDLLLVSWEAASDENGSIKGYLITSILIDRGQCGTLGEKEDLRQRQTQLNDTEITLQNLNPYSTYNVSVQARNAAGLGDPISTLAVTAPSVPSQAPTNVRLVLRTNASLQFAWDAIPCLGANGEILYYEYAVLQNKNSSEIEIGLRTKRSLENHTHTTFDSVEDVTVTIQHLKPFTNYGFTVGGATAVGTGIMSEVIFYKTDEGVPDEPQALSIIMVSSDSLKISWMHPKLCNGIITRYRIRAYKQGEEELASEIIHRVVIGEDNSKIIEGLSPHSAYKITVEASTKAGWGKDISLIEKTLEAAPGEPSEVSVVEYQQTTLNISWKEPLNNNGILLGYKIEYYPISTLDQIFNSTPFTSNTMEFSPDINEAYLQDLHASTQYSVAVSARTSKGYGPPAELICWTTILGDHVSPSLKMLAVEATNETIPIIFSTKGSSSVYKYQVIVEDSRHDDSIEEDKLSSFESAVVKNNLPYYIAAELDPSDVSQTDEHTFIVGDRKVWGGYKNVHLNPGHKYKIRIRTLVKKDKELKSVLSNPRNETAKTQTSFVTREKTRIAGFEVFAFVLIVIGCLVFLTIVIFLTVLTAYYKRRQRKKSTTSFSTKDSGLSGSMTWSVMYKAPDSEPMFDGASVIDSFRTLPLKEKNASLKRCRSDSKIAKGMRIETLENYLMTARNRNQLVDEFKKLVEGQTSSWAVARKSVNLKKNRYGNILPYDRYRVVLQTDSNKGDSDYINASYIDGFRRPKEYIVTQGPLENTIVDFWRMVWQENCPVIVMITDLVENGKVKCAKYWPEDSMDCGDMHVLIIHQDETSDFILRTILIRKIDEIRTHRVLQYQYAGWPDRNVPSNINSFIKFMKKIRDDHPVMSGPMVVHCSAGAGRSGAYVAIDALCQQAAEDRRVDVFRFVNNARHQRVHLVQTLEQYAFIYEALIEAIQFEDTSIPLQNISLYLKELNHMSTLDRTALILKQYNKLNRAQKKVDVSNCSNALSEINIFKNRDPLTIPNDFSRIKLDVTDDEDEDGLDYINAVLIDGYRKPNSYLVTQMPLTHTIEDFYRLAYQHRSPLVLMLNGCDESDEMSVGIYWPELGECKYGDFYVELLAFEEQGDFVIRVLKVIHLRKKNDEPLQIIQLQYNGWTSEMKPETVLNLIEVVDMWYERTTGGPIIVHCMDGATRCGLFIAASHVCEQIKQEGVLDAFHIVRSIRVNRPEFIPNADQFRLLFEIAQEIAEPILLQNEEITPSTKKLSFKI